ncbi:pirin family protein, partial [Kitasatospora sp. NPDC047058]
NFIGRTNDDIARARTDWMTTNRFGDVHGYAGDRLPAPELPAVPLKPRGRVR